MWSPLLGSHLCVCKCSQTCTCGHLYQAVTCVCASVVKPAHVVTSIRQSPVCVQVQSNLHMWSPLLGSNLCVCKCSQTCTCGHLYQAVTCVCASVVKPAHVVTSIWQSPVCAGIVKPVHVVTSIRQSPVCVQVQSNLPMWSPLLSSHLCVQVQELVKPANVVPSNKQSPVLKKKTFFLSCHRKFQFHMN